MVNIFLTALGRTPALLLALAIAGPFARAHDDPSNRLVSFARSGAWEVWCLDVGGTGKIECDLNLVINYVPNPNFRGMIPRVYLAADGSPFLRLDYESQTSFARGYVQPDGGQPFSLAECERPCIVDGPPARDLIERLAAAKSATIHFHDYLVEAFHLPIDLDGFADGLRKLRAMQALYR